jgi:hypothetical protein
MDKKGLLFNIPLQASSGPVHYPTSSTPLTVYNRPCVPTYTPDTSYTCIARTPSLVSHTILQYNLHTTVAC